MASNTNRITSKDIYMEFLPMQTVEDTLEYHLYFDSAVDGGTFKLAVNGETTADITMTGTAATDVAAINAALDALDNLSAAELVASGTAITDIQIDAAANGFYLIELVDGYADTLTQSVPNTNDKVTEEVVVWGSVWTKVSTDISSFDWEESAGTVDVTAISEVARTEIPVDRTCSGSISNYAVTASVGSLIPFMFRAEGCGTLRVFKEGKIIGKEVLELFIVVDSYSESTPDHEKIEQEISWMRQGDWIKRPGSIWRG